MKTKGWVRTGVRLPIAAAMILGLPFLGVALSGLPVDRYLEFPPKTRYVSHAPFSWVAFSVFALLDVSAVACMWWLNLKGAKGSGAEMRKGRSFPWWGWLGACSGLVFWFLSWTRFSWYSPFQAHTFTPLWLSYILILNALSYSRDGTALMIDHPFFFVLLFPFSAGFWWVFEFLNRFVQNWYYTGVQFGRWGYFWYATLSFSTVLPAFETTRLFMARSSWIRSGFTGLPAISVFRSRAFGWGLLIGAGAGSAGIGVWPDYLFPLVWVSPLLIITSMSILDGDRHIFEGVSTGDWRLLVSSAAAALTCGWFWEMWNFCSLAKWHYEIPLVNRFRLFEMPILGYGGYLPFGMACSAAVGWLRRLTLVDRR